jgi:NAD(P)-dependent dehydrogenase (short-subunit alcohol dehydrogenase family)
MYTSKLGMHYFIKQNGTSSSYDQQDTCLVLISSGAGYFDVPRTPQYCTSKWAIRGIMHALRRIAPYYGGRVNIIAPWYVKTKILSEQAFRKVEEARVEFATTKDGKACLLRILSDQSIDGRTLFLSARKWAPNGYFDLGLDDYVGNELLQEIQAGQMGAAPVEAGVFV